MTGFDDDDAVAFARMLRRAGCDIVDVSSGQVWPEQRPAYGRSYQTPFADRIRHEAGITSPADAGAGSEDPSDEPTDDETTSTETMADR